MQIILVCRHVNSVLSKRGSVDYSLPLRKKRFLHSCTFILIFLIYKCVCSFQPVITSAWFPHWLGSRIKSFTRIHFDIWQSWFYPCCENYFLTPVQPQKWSTPKLETQMGTARDVRTQMRTDGENREVEKSSCSQKSCRSPNTKQGMCFSGNKSINQKIPVISSSSLSLSKSQLKYKTC